MGRGLGWRARGSHPASLLGAFMFESLLLRRRKRSRAGLPLSVVLHAGVIALALLAVRTANPTLEFSPEVRVFGPLRALPTSRAASAPRPRPALQRRRAMVQPTSI